MRMKWKATRFKRAKKRERDCTRILVISHKCDTVNLYTHIRTESTTFTSQSSKFVATMQIAFSPYSWSHLIVMASLYKSIVYFLCHLNFGISIRKLHFQIAICCMAALVILVWNVCINVSNEVFVWNCAFCMRVCVCNCCHCCRWIGVFLSLLLPFVFTFWREKLLPIFQLSQKTILKYNVLITLITSNVKSDQCSFCRVNYYFAIHTINIHKY